MTITIEGRLADFKRDACKAKLAQLLDMSAERFELKAKRIKGRGGVALHEVETGAGCSVHVDIDEQGYLRHVELGSSEGSGSEVRCSMSSAHGCMRSAANENLAARCFTLADV